MAKKTRPDHEIEHMTFSVDRERLALLRAQRPDLSLTDITREVLNLLLEKNNEPPLSPDAFLACTCDELEHR